MLRAAELGRFDVVSLLFDHGAVLTENGSFEVQAKWLEAAARGGSQKVFSLFLAKGSERPADSLELILAALSSGDFEILKRIFELGAELNSADSVKILSAMDKHLRSNSSGVDRNSPYARELQSQSLQQFEYLMAKGLQLQTEEKLSYEFLRKLLSRFRNPASASTPEIAKRLTFRQEFVMRSIKLGIDSGLDINHVGSDGSTLLLIAAVESDFQSVEYLVSLGADLTFANRRGKTATDIIALKLAIALDRTPDKLKEIEKLSKAYKLLGGKLTDLPVAPKKRTPLFLDLLKQMG